jgi:hypothetical protein
LRLYATSTATGCNHCFENSLGEVLVERTKEAVLRDLKKAKITDVFEQH